MATSYFIRAENSIINAWNGGERSMNKLYNLIEPPKMLCKSHIAFIIWWNFGNDALELVA